MWGIAIVNCGVCLGRWVIFWLSRSWDQDVGKPLVLINFGHSEKWIKMGQNTHRNILYKRGMPFKLAWNKFGKLPHFECKRKIYNVRWVHESRMACMYVQFFKNKIKYPIKSQEPSKESKTFQNTGPTPAFTPWSFQMRELTCVISYRVVRYFFSRATKQNGVLLNLQQQTSESQKLIVGKDLFWRLTDYHLMTKNMREFWKTLLFKSSVDSLFVPPVGPGLYVYTEQQQIAILIRKSLGHWGTTPVRR